MTLRVENTDFWKRIVKNVNAQCSLKCLSWFYLLLFYSSPEEKPQRGLAVTWRGRVWLVSACPLALHREGSSCMAKVWLTNLSIPVSEVISISSSFSPTRVQTDSLFDSLAPPCCEEASRSKFVSSAMSILYVSGLKEESEVKVASTVLRPCQPCWWTESWREELDDSQGCLYKTSLNVALRLGGRSREESMLLQAWVCLDKRGSVWPGGRGKSTVCVGETGRVSSVETGTNIRGFFWEVGARSAVVSGECVNRGGRERVWCWRSAARSRLEILAWRRVTSDSCRGTKWQCV